MRNDQASDDSHVPPASAGWPIAGVVFRWVLVAALFFTYPLALLCPVRTGPSLVFYFSLPWFGLLSTLAGALILLELPRGSLHWVALPAVQRRDLRISPLWLLLIPVGCVLRARLTQAASLIPAVELGGYFLVPAWVALCRPAFLPVRLPLILGVLWLLAAGHGLWQYAVGFEVVGLAGNRNWMATLVVALLPWALAAVGGAAGRGWEQMRANAMPAGNRAPAGAPWAAWFIAWLPANRGGRIAAVAIVAITLFLAVQARSRAMWLVAAAYVILWLVPHRLPRKTVWLGAIVAFCLAGTFLAMHSKRVADTVRRDIRLPLWSGTAELIADHALFGVGPGNFRREYPARKPLAHKMRDVAAPVTEHPHNELLHVAAVLGIPLALLWLLTLAPLAMPGAAMLPVQATIHFSAWMVLGHAFFDKTLVQQPTGVLGLVMLGLLWRPRLAAAPTGQPEPCRAGACVLGLLLVLGGALFAGVPLAQSAWFVRQGMVAEAAGRGEDAFKAFDLASRLSPGDVQAATLAGMVANHGLHSPQLALERLQHAAGIEPDYAHLNGEFGSVLGQLGGDVAALPFFEREAWLFPLDPLALRQALYCRVANQVPNWDWKSDLAHLVILDRHRAEYRLSAATVTAAVREFCFGMRHREPERAVAAARRLTDMRVHDWVTDPLYSGLAAAVGKDAPDPLAPFGAADLAYWDEQFRLRPLAAQVCPQGKFDAATVQALLNRPDGVRILQVLGWDTVRLSSAGEPEWRVAFLSDGEADLFYLPEAPLLVDAAAELPPAARAVLQALMSGSVGGAEIRACWEVQLLESCARTQILMNILAPGFPAASALRTGLVPSVQAFVLRQRLDRALLRSADAPYGVVWSVAASSGAARPEPKPMNGNQ